MSNKRTVKTKKKEEQCNCREIEKELALSYYSQEDGNTYTLPILHNKKSKGKVSETLPDGSTIDYYDGLIVSLGTGKRAYVYHMEEDERGVLTESEIVYKGSTEITRHINIFTLTSWNRFSCDQNVYVTDKGEELHYCLHNPTPDYEGKIVKIIDPYGEEMDFSEVR